MFIDSFEQSSIKKVEIDGAEKLTKLHEGFTSMLKDDAGHYLVLNETATDSISAWLGENAALTTTVFPYTIDSIRNMYTGADIFDEHTLGLEKIHAWPKHPEYEYQCYKQHAGYAAEVISTVKENLIFKREATGITTYRTDDRPDLYHKNDPYVDKIRINDKTGEIVERVQTKFVGKDGKSSFAKLKTKGFRKYFMEDKVDKVEIPKDYYDEVKLLAKDQITDLENQIDYLKAHGKEELIPGKQDKLELLKKIDQKIEKSTVTSQEALDAVKNPKKYVNKIFAREVISEGHKVGVESGLGAAGLSAAISTVDNVQKFFSGEVTAKEAVEDIAKDTGVAGVIGYGTGFVTDAVANTMRGSSHELIKAAGSSCAPAVVAWGVQSFDSIIDYAQGEIGAEELAYDLGENAAGVVGGIAAGAAVGSIVPGAGTVVGAGAGFVGSIVGCALASEAYATAVEYGGQGAEAMAAKAQELATNTVELAKIEVPEKVDFIRESINGFAAENDIPIRV